MMDVWCMERAMSVYIYVGRFLVPRYELTKLNKASLTNKELVNDIWV